MDKIKGVANTHFFFNGQMEDSIKNKLPFDIGLPTGGYPKILIDNPLLVKVVYWFKNGWDRNEDIENAFNLILTFKNLRLFYTDINPQYIAKKGLADSIDETFKASGRLKNSSNSRVHYLYVFKENKNESPILSNLNVLEPIMMPKIKEILETLAKCMAEGKGSRKDRAKKLKVENEPQGKPIKKLKTIANANKTYTLTEDMVELLLRNQSFPVNCKTVKQKLIYLKDPTVERRTVPVYSPSKIQIKDLSTDQLQKLINELSQVYREKKVSK